MRSFRSRTRRSEASPDKIVRLFQSETGEILETPEPVALRITVGFLAVFLVSLVLLAVSLAVLIGLRDRWLGAS